MTLRRYLHEPARSRFQATAPRQHATENVGQEAAANATRVLPLGLKLDFLTPVAYDNREERVGADTPFFSVSTLLQLNKRWPTMRSNLDGKREALAAICRAYGVSRLELFGSAARGRDFDPQTSDIDFLVEFHPVPSMSALKQFVGLAQELEALFGRNVDLVETASIKNPYVLAAVNRSREVVYGA
jgi:predicted nucleotidyltransferase